MSVDLNTVVPVNGLNDYIAQPPKDDDDAAAAAAALSEQLSLNGVAHASSQSMESVVSLVSSEDGDDVSVAVTDVPSPIDDVFVAATDVPSPIDDVFVAATDVPSPIDETVALPLDGKGEDKKSDIQDVNTDSPLVHEPIANPCEDRHPPPQQVVPVDVPDLKIANPSSSSDEVPENEIKQEVIDLGIDPHFYEEIEKPVETEKKVGYDRGLEPDYIVGATDKGGKLMLLVAWKNSVDGEADLLEATEIYKKSPQVAIKFFEERLCYIPPSERRN